MSLVVIYNRNQRTTSGRGLAFLCRCFFTGDTVTGGLGSQRKGLWGVSSLTLALNSRIALCLCGLRTRFSGTFIRARPLANTDHATGSSPLRWRKVSLTRSTRWEPGMGLVSYNSSPLERFSFECRKVIGFALSTRCDWLKRFAPPFYPIRSKTKANCDALACIFPRFASATCNYFEFWLVQCIVCVLCDWPE